MTDDDLVRALRDAERDVGPDPVADRRIRQRMAAAFEQAESPTGAGLTDLRSYVERRTTPPGGSRLAFATVAAAVILIAAIGLSALRDADPTPDDTASMDELAVEAERIDELMDQLFEGHIGADGPLPHAPPSRPSGRRRG